MASWSGQIVPDRTTTQRGSTVKTRRVLLTTTALFLMFSGCGSASDGIGSGGDGPVVEEQAKETIPLEEEEVGRRSAIQSASGAFNSCLDDAGYTFRGFAGDDATDDAVTGDPGYQSALQRCNAESGIGDLRADFAESRASRTPEQIREANEQILKVVDCLRSMGWELDDPTQDQTGGLNLRDVLRDSGVDIRGNEDARDCFSEMRLNRD